MTPNGYSVPLSNQKQRNWVRLIIDFKNLNKHFKFNPNPIPGTSQIVLKLEEFKYTMSRNLVAKGSNPIFWSLLVVWILVQVSMLENLVDEEYFWIYIQVLDACDDLSFYVVYIVVVWFLIHISCSHMYACMISFPTSAYACPVCFLLYIPEAYII